MKTRKSYYFIYSIITSATLASVAATNTFADGRVVQGKSTTVLITGQSAAAIGPNAAGNSIDYPHAIAMPLPQAWAQPTSQLDSLLEAQGSAASAVSGVASGVSTGGKGTGKLNPVTLVPPGSSALGTQDEVLPQDLISPQEYGTSNHVYTTSRTDAYGDATTRYYPFRAAGKLWFNIGGGTYVCSASLIKPGVVVTAAHCVANYGQRQFYSNWQFAPAYDQGVAPYGVATAKSATVMTSYYNGTDPCYQYGVVCQNDVAVIVLNSNVGNSAGWYSYGWNGYSYANNQALITQLGYPVALDSGSWQERTDSQGFVSSAMSGNTVIGSLQTGGSSGGPWVVNLGMPPTLSGISFGTAASHNVVVGVTSWGYTNSAVKEQGASPFTSNNIVSLVNTVCSSNPGSC